MKRIIILVVGFMLIGATLFAGSGDLIVNGNLGVGTPGPGGKLEISDGTNRLMAQIGPTTYWGTYNAADFGLMTNNNARLYITSAGNVGIGTTGPGAKLHVIHPGETQTSYTMRLQSSPSTGGAGGILFDQGSTYAYKWHTSNTGGPAGLLELNYITVSDGNVVYGPVLGIKSGYVGIGTTSPSRKLFVYGDAGGTSAWYNDSDRGLKKDIREIDNGLDQVLKLRGVYFTWNDTETRGEGRQVGMIAQEVKEIVPEVVQKKGDYYSIATANLVPLLVEAIKEQQKEIDTLKVKQASMEQQQALISALYEKVNMLENQMKLQGTVAQVDY